MRAILVLMVSLLACARATGAWAQMDLPDPRLTPGALNPGVTQENIGDTICVAWEVTQARAAGSGCSRNVASVMSPRVPADPAKSLPRS